MTVKKRRRFTASEKGRAVVRHLQDGVSVSAICDEFGIHPNQFYGWQKQALEGLPTVFERESGSAERRQQRRIERLEADLGRKNDVIAELLSEHITLKKKFGES